MRYAFELVTGPEFEAVSLAEARLHLNCFSDQTDDDDEITGLITGAREWIEDYTGRALIDETWRLTVDQTGGLIGDSVRGYTNLPGFLPLATGYYYGAFLWASRVGEIFMRKSPVLAVTSFVTVAADGTETAIDASTYQLREADSKWPRIVPLSGATWMTADFRLTFRAGYADTTGSPQQTAAEVPFRFKQAMKLWVQANYHGTDPANMQLLMTAAANLIRSERVEMGFA